MNMIFDIGVTFHGSLIFMEDKLSRTITFPLPTSLDKAIIKLLPIAPAPPTTKIFLSLKFSDISDFKLISLIYFLLGLFYFCTYKVFFKKFTILTEAVPSPYGLAFFKNEL